MKQITGDKQPLQNGPGNYTNSRFQGGSKQITGDDVSLKSTPSRLTEFSKGESGGTMQILGDDQKLKENSAFHGWQSYNTPMSDRSEEQSKKG